MSTIAHNYLHSSPVMCIESVHYRKYLCHKVDHVIAYSVVKTLGIKSFGKVLFVGCTLTFFYINTQSANVFLCQIYFGCQSNQVFSDKVFYCMVTYHGTIFHDMSHVIAIAASLLTTRQSYRL